METPPSFSRPPPHTSSSAQPVPSDGWKPSFPENASMDIGEPTTIRQEGVYRRTSLAIPSDTRRVPDVDHGMASAYGD